MERKLRILGWREWVTLPDLKISHIKAKIDSGARTSALHAENIHYYLHHGVDYVGFTLFPEQKKREPSHQHCAPLKEKRVIRSSVGVETFRPVIETSLQIGNYCLPIELTLIDRGMMGVRMLIGREAIRNRFLIDTGRSFLLGHPK